MGEAVHDGQVRRRKDSCFRFDLALQSRRKAKGLYRQCFKSRVTMDASRLGPLEELLERGSDSWSPGYGF